MLRFCDVGYSPDKEELSNEENIVPRSSTSGRRLKRDRSCNSSNANDSGRNCERGSRRQPDRQFEARGSPYENFGGNPSSASFYSILLFVPAHTTIQAHSHRDDRMATVVSGNWQFGYGAHFEESALKPLPAGSVYSEPAGVNDFARTTDTPVVVHISGYGPTDTRYFNPADDPDSIHKN